MTNDVNLLIVHGSKGVKSAKVAETKENNKIKVVILQQLNFIEANHGLLLN